VRLPRLSNAWKNDPDRVLAFLGQILNEDVRQIGANEGCTQRNQELDHGRVRQFPQDKKIEHRQRKDDEGRSDPEEHVGRERSLASEAGPFQLVTQVLVLKQLTQIEALDHLLREALRRVP
jgi:hypothetical protein